MGSPRRGGGGGRRHTEGGAGGAPDGGGAGWRPRVSSGSDSIRTSPLVAISPRRESPVASLGLVIPDGVRLSEERQHTVDDQIHDPPEFVNFRDEEHLVGQNKRNDKAEIQR